MRIILNRKVATKLWIMISPAIIALIIFCIQSGYQQNKILKNSRETYYEIVAKTSNLILNADRDFYHAAMVEKEEILSRDSLTDERIEELVDIYDSKVALVLSEMNAAYKNLENHIHLRKEFKHPTENLSFTEIYDNFSIHFASWKAAFNLETGIGDLERRENEFNRTRNDFKLMNELLDEYGSYANEQIKQSVQDNISILSAVISIIILYISYMSYVVINYFRKNMKNLTADMKALTNNDLSFEPHQVNSRDELGELSSAVSTMIASLREIMANLNLSSANLSQSSSKMRINSNEVSNSMNEIASTISDIAEGAGNQAEDTDSLANEITRLGDVVLQNSRSADSLLLVSNQIEKASQEGLGVVNQLDTVTKDNQDAFQSIFDIVSETSNKAAQIGEASNMIAGIARQTNLLALNAAIEAARAGEAGKGFAVVADEIRILAEKSATSTRIIDAMLAELSSSIAEADQKSRAVKEAVRVQTKSVVDTKDKYVAIVASIEAIKKEIEALDHVSKEVEQSRLIVMDYAKNLSMIAQGNAASTEEASATTEEVLAAMITIGGVGEEVDILVLELKALIDRFKL